MPRKPHSVIVDRLRRDLSSLVRESTEIRERCAATAQPDVQPIQSTISSRAELTQEAVDIGLAFSVNLAAM